MSTALCTLATEGARTPADHDSAAASTSALQAKVQRQALQIHEYETQVAWSSRVARCCLDHLRRVDPSVDVTNLIGVHEVSIPVYLSEFGGFLNYFYKLFAHGTLCPAAETTSWGIVSDGQRPEQEVCRRLPGHVPAHHIHASSPQPTDQDCSV
jgi:hypothetical protein